MATNSPIETWILGDNKVAKERFQKLLVDHFKVEEKTTVLLTRTQFSEKLREINSDVRVMIVFPDEERSAVVGSRGKSFEEEIQSIGEKNQDGVMIVVYDDESGDLEGRCCPKSLQKKNTETEIMQTLINKDRFLILKRNVFVNEEQEKAIRGFLQLPEPPPSRSLGDSEENPGAIAGETGSGSIPSDGRSQGQEESDLTTDQPGSVTQTVNTTNDKEASTISLCWCRN